VPADRAPCVERTADTSAVALFGISSSMLLQRPLDAAIEFATREGLTAFEVWADHPHAHPDETPKAVRARLRHELKGFARISVHGPLGNASLASINPGIWRESLRQHLATVELAHDIGAAVLVVHPGDLRDARFAADFTRLAGEALGRLARRAEQLGVTLAVENCGPYHAGIDRNAEDLAALLAHVGSPRLKACLDTGHGAVNGNLADLVRLLGDAIVHLHVHDNHGQRDEHLPVGRGTIDFSVLLPLLARFDGMAIAEVVWDNRDEGETPEELLHAAQAGWTAVQPRS
jgi:sugar phosphate isomerase/epimerase